MGASFSPPPAAAAPAPPPPPPAGPAMMAGGKPRGAGVPIFKGAAAASPQLDAALTKLAGSDSTLLG